VAAEATGHELVAGSDVRLVFADGAVSGSGGCNSFVATPYAIDAGVLVVDGPMGMTEMACDPPALMDQDTWLAELLTSRPTVALDDPTLTLTSGGDTVTFTDREVADPDRPLEGTAWELESLVSADAVASVPAGVRVSTLAIAGGQISVDLGCNTGSGPVTVSADTLEIGPLATTRMACEGDAGAVETKLLEVLEGTVDYTIEADVLTIMNGDVGAVYRAAG
jgi:heat shock protein HslJ